MLRVNLFLVGYKGFDALTHILSYLDLKLINAVVIGQDQGVSNDFSSELIDLCKKVRTSIGKPIKKLHNSEKILNKILSRRLVCRNNINKGSKFNYQNIKPALVYKNKGLKTNEFFKVINKKVKKNLLKGHIIQKTDF